MRLQDVLAAVPGLEKRFVHYLEGQGYIRPRKLQKERIARRDYSEADLHRIRDIWRYYQRGISVQRAFELVTRVQADGAYVYFPAPSRHWGEALDLLTRHSQVVEASAVYGESADIFVRLRAPHESDVYAVLDALLEAGIISGPPHVLRFAAGDTWRLEHHDEASVGHRAVAAPPVGKAHMERMSQRDDTDHTMRAWVLIKVPAKQIGGLVEELRSFPGIVEASAIYGETDVIAKIEVADQRALDELVVQRIQSMSAVESTRTFIAIGGLHWQRTAR